MIFQVAAMPRSGTAWLSTLLNLAPDVYTAHEPLDKNVSSPRLSYAHSGQSGSHLIVPQYRDMRCDLRIYIDRPSEDCYNSTAELFGDDMISKDKWEEEVHDRAIKYSAGADFAVKFDKLFTVPTVKYIWESITDYDFQEDKVRAMIGMNVQRHALDFDLDEEFFKSVIGEEECH